MAFAARFLCLRNYVFTRILSQKFSSVWRIASCSQTLQGHFKLLPGNILRSDANSTNNFHSSAVVCTFLHENPRNHKIKAKSVLLIDSNGEQLGTMSIKEALDRATENALQLVQIQSQKGPNPAICKLVSSRTLYESEKKAKHNTHASKSKVLKITGRIAPQDLQWKSKKIHDFLEHGHTVKLTVTRKHYQKISIAEKMEIIEHIKTAVKDVGVVDSGPKELGTLAVSCTFKPLSQKDKAKA